MITNEERDEYLKRIAERSRANADENLPRRPVRTIARVRAGAFTVVVGLLEGGDTELSVSSGDGGRRRIVSVPLDEKALVGVLGALATAERERREPPADDAA